MLIIKEFFDGLSGGGISLQICFYTFMTALFSSLIMVPFLRQWALSQGTVDVPDKRKVHVTPTPRLGGVAIFLAFLLATLSFAPIVPAVRGILVGGLIIFVTGLVDDLHGLSAKHKFTGEVIACLCTIGIGRLWLSDLGNLFGFGDILLPAWFGIPFTVFAVVGVINAINLIDGLDGLSGGVSVIALSAFLLMGILDECPSVILLSAALLGAVLGFLKYNFYPARIFMGDVGSLTVGFVLGFLAVQMTQHTGATISPMVPIVILGLPILDTLRVMQRRIRKNLRPFSPDQTHVHHKFLNYGFEHRFTVLVLYTLTLFWACFAVIFRHWPEYWLLASFLVLGICIHQVLRYLLKQRDQLPWLQRDSNRSLRNSATFEKIAGLVDLGLPVVSVLLGLFLLLAVVSFTSVSVIPWQILIGLLVGSLILYLRTSSRPHDEFMLLVVYFVGFIAAYQVWSTADLTLFGLSLKRCGDLLLMLIALLVVLKLVVHRPGEFYLSTPDYLVLGLCIFFAVASGEAVLDLNLTGPLLRAVIVMVALRTVVTHNSVNHRYAVLGSLALLLLATGVGLLGA